MTTKIILPLILMSVLANSAHSACEENVDEIDVFYINGMFTPWGSYLTNKDDLSFFISTHLADDGFSDKVSGHYNYDEPSLEQILEVARQKLEDVLDSGPFHNNPLILFLNSDYSFISQEDMSGIVTEFIEEIVGPLSTIGNEADTLLAIAGVKELLEQCGRVVLVSHSQGNFYANAVMDSIYNNYLFPNGYTIMDYPMLGNMQIASPVNTPGGFISATYPEIIGHLTNDVDLIMALVRNAIGSVDSNYFSLPSFDDITGHSLSNSYLFSTGQGNAIAEQMRGIVNSLYPYPLHNQVLANSSALSGFGYTAINQLLDIEFTTGGVYRYESVGEELFSGLNSASSQGTYFNENIRDVFPYTKIED